MTQTTTARQSRDRAGDDCGLAEGTRAPGMDSAAAVQFLVPTAALRPLAEEVARELLTQLRQAEAAVPIGQLAYPEEQAARMLGLQKHQLRDERLRGRIRGNRIVGRRIVYEREE